MTEYSRVPGVVPKDEMTEYSQVPGVPTADSEEMTEYSREYLEFQTLKWLSTRKYLENQKLTWLSIREYVEHRKLKWPSTRRESLEYRKSWDDWVLGSTWSTKSWIDWVLAITWTTKSWNDLSTRKYLEYRKLEWLEYSLVPGKTEITGTRRYCCGTLDNLCIVGYSRRVNCGLFRFFQYI